MIQRQFFYYISNTIEEYGPFISLVDKAAPYMVTFISFEEFLKAEILENLPHGVRETDVFIALDFTFYQEHKEELKEYLDRVFKKNFPNILHLYKKIEDINILTYQAGLNYCHLLPATLDECTQSAAENLAVSGMVLFYNTILSVRLTNYISHSFSEVVATEQLKQKNREIELLNSKLEHLNKMDFLTNLYNRNTLYSFLEQERKRTLRGLWRLNDKEDEDDGGYHGHHPEGAFLDHFGTFSVLMIDIDHFKQVNDTYGHLVGDDVLKFLGSLLTKPGVFRETDIAGRFGGEEFIVMLPETNVLHAENTAQRLSELFKAQEFTGPGGRTFHVTLSIGISEYHIEDSNNEDIIARADEALYYSKNNGRDRITIYEHVFDQD